MPVTDSPDTPRHTGVTAERILFLLKTRGPLKTAYLGPMLNITPEAARQQIQKLVETGMIVGCLIPPVGAGRPSQKWILTDAAQARFPNTHAQLTAQLIVSIKLIYGSEGIDKVVETMELANTREYIAACEQGRNLEEKVRLLVDIRDTAGYMASMEAEGENWLIIENHCPICVAAQQCQGFCRAELQVFQAAIGDAGQVERTEHMITGNRRCVYRVTPV